MYSRDGSNGGEGISWMHARWWHSNAIRVTDSIIGTGKEIIFHKKLVGVGKNYQRISFRVNCLYYLVYYIADG